MYIWSWKNKKFVLFTLKIKFLPNKFTKMYKFWIKTGVLYPKMYIWYWKNKKFVLFTLRIKSLPKDFTKMYKFWIKTGVLYPKMYIWSWKNKKFVLFTLKIKFLPKNFTKISGVLFQKCTFGREKKITFYTKNCVFAKKFHQNKFWIKTRVLYPKMYIWSWKNKKIELFTLKIAFLPKHFTKMYKFWIKTGVLYPKCTFGPEKNKLICTFYTKN